MITIPIVISLIFVVVIPIYEKSIKESVITEQTFAELLKNGQVEEFNELRKNWNVKLEFVEIDLSDINLSGINLKLATFTNSNFTTANLTGADLRDANLSGVYFTEADLSGANFTGADLRDVYLTGADLRNAQYFSISKEEARERGAIVDDSKPVLDEKDREIIDQINNNVDTKIAKFSQQNNDTKDILIDALKQNNATMTAKIVDLNRILEDSRQETQMWQYVSIAVGFTVAVVFFILGRKI